MSEHHNKIDRKYIEGLYDLEFDLDTNEMWSDMESRLDQKKKRRPIFIWIVALATGFLGLLFALNQFVLNIDTVKKETIVEDSIASHVEKDADPKRNTHSQSVVTQSSEQQLVEDNTSINTSDITTVITAEVDKSDVYKTSIDHREGSTNTSGRYTLDVATNIEDRASPLIGLSKGKYPNKLDVELRKDFLDATITNHANIASANFNKHQENNSVLIDKAIEDVPLLFTDFKMLDKKGWAIPSLFPVNKPKTKAMGISLALESSIYYSRSKSKSDYITPLPSFDLNLSVAIPLSNALQLKTGIEYLQINEKFDFENVVSVKEAILAEDAYYMENDNGTQYFEDSLYIVNRTLHKRKQLNTYKNWNIPIGLAFIKGTDSWSFGLEATAIVNLSSSFNGYLLNEQRDDIISVNNDHPEFKSRVGIGFRLRPSVSYPLSSHVTISMALPFRLSPYSDISQNNYWKAAGLSTGFRFRLL